MDDEDWIEAFKAAFVGDALDFLLDSGMLKPVGDAIDLLYTLPKMKEALPEEDKNLTYGAAFGESVPVFELLPTWTILTTGSFVKQQLKKEGEKVPELGRLIEKFRESSPI